MVQGVARILFLVWLLYLAKNYATLRHIPGPFLAGCSNFWRLIIVGKGNSQDTFVQLHKTYGDVVRIGPNVVSVIGAEALSAIYGVGNKLFLKVSHILLPANGA